MKVLPADAPERAELEAQGWTVVARSFGAQLDAHAVDEPRLQGRVARAAEVGSVHELSAADIHAVLALDALTIGDYPGSIAMQHTPLDRQRATPSASRRAFGVVLGSGELVAMTFVDVDGSDAETDFTVVHPDWRGRGLGVAAKAASVLALLTDGVTRFRTGGSADNVAILAANDVVGYVRDEEWVTLEPGGR